MLRLNFDTSSDAFAVANGRPEIARILRGLAERIDCRHEIWTGTISDAAGRVVGTWRLTGDREPAPATRTVLVAVTVPVDMIDDAGPIDVVHLVRDGLDALDVVDGHEIRIEERR